MRQRVVPIRSEPGNLFSKYNLDLGLRDQLLVAAGLLPNILQQSADWRDSLHDVDLHGHAASLGVLPAVPLHLEVRRHQVGLQRDQNRLVGPLLVFHVVLGWRGGGTDLLGRGRTGLALYGPEPLVRRRRPHAFHRRAEPDRVPLGTARLLRLVDRRPAARPGRLPPQPAHERTLLPLAHPGQTDLRLAGRVHRHAVHRRDRLRRLHLTRPRRHAVELRPQHRNRRLRSRDHRQPNLDHHRRHLPRNHLSHHRYEERHPQTG